MSNMKRWLRSAVSMLLALCLVLGAPVTALAAGTDYCSGQTEAEAAVADAKKYYDLADDIVEIIETMIEDYDGIFKGTATSDRVKSIALGIIEDEITDQMMKDLGFEVTDANRTMLAEEAYEAACIYYDEINVNGGDSDTAHKKTAVELIRFTLNKAKGYSEGDAKKTAEMYYDLGGMSEDAAVEKALSTYGYGKAHIYGDPTWNWESDYSKATAVFGCTGCTDKQTVNATVTSVSDGGNCETGGTITYTAKVTFNGKEYTDTEDKTLDVSGHSYGEAAWTWAEDYSSAAVSKTCGKCGKSVEAKAEITSEKVDNTCTKDGSVTYTAKATMDNTKYTDTKTQTLKATGHSYTAKGWTWTDYSAASVELVCDTCKESVKKEAVITSKTTDPTCTNNGSTVYTATVTIDGTDYTDSKSVVIEAEGEHVYGQATWTWAEDYTTASVSKTCTECGDVIKADATITATVVEGDCVTDGTATYTAKATLDGTEYTDTKTVTTEASDHTYGDVTWVWGDDYVFVTASMECTACGEKVSSRARVTIETKDATCAEDGYITYTATATLDGTQYTDVITVKISATGEHTFTATWTWAEDYSSATVSAVCDVCELTGEKDATIEVTTEAATCVADGATTYTATAKIEGISLTDTKVVAIEATGHSYGEAVWTWEEDYSGATVSLTCGNCAEAISADADITSTTVEGNCQKDGSVTYVATAELNDTTYTDTKVETVPGEHDFVDDVCSVCGMHRVKRVYGDDRCATAIAVADMMKETLGITYFDAIIIANGDVFADALAGSYLANELEAPILLYRASAVNMNLEYIKKNLSGAGVVYLLGGTAAIPENVRMGLENAGITVKRLAGETRFETNIAILNEAGVSASQEILVCTGYEFADSLSASATGLPILLVNNGTGVLTPSQVQFLESLNGAAKITIVGGTEAISDALESALDDYGTISRVYGATRYETSVAVAERYFTNPEFAVLAYGRNFPDGLCGGPLAFVMGAPLLLTQAGNEAVAAEYVADNGIVRGVALGGPAVLTDATINAVF